MANTAGDKQFLYLKSRPHGYLTETGWLNSTTLNKPVDKNSTPIPWLTYPFIEFIKERLDSNYTMLEFGSGSSTIYFASKLKHTLSFEDNHEWFNIIQAKLPSNASIIYYKTLDEINSCLCAGTNQYDIVLVDSTSERDRFADTAVAYLKKTGIIILDDTEHESFRSAVKLLTSKGFKKIDFWGLAPCITYQKCTTIFYKDNNCLNI